MTAATVTAASSARAERAEKRVSSVKLPSNPFAGKQYLGLILPLALIALWYILSTNGVFTQVQLPSPDRVVSAGVELAQRGELGRHVAISTQRVLIGFGIGAVLGLVLGALIGLSAPVRLIAAPTIGALRAVPSLAWVPLLLLWIGIGENSKVTLVAIGAFFPVYTTVSAALAHVDPKLVEAARAFGLKGSAPVHHGSASRGSAVGGLGSASGAGSGVAVPGRRRAAGRLHGSGLPAD